MPKTLGELKDAKRGVKKAAGKKIDFEPIAQMIIRSGQYFTKREVWSSPNMVNKRVSLFRTKKLLDAKVAGRRMTRLYMDGKFYYGAPEQKAAEPAAAPAQK